MLQNQQFEAEVILKCLSLVLVFIQPLKTVGALKNLCIWCFQCMSTFFPLSISLLLFFSVIYFPHSPLSVILNSHYKRTTSSSALSQHSKIFIRLSPLSCPPSSPACHDSSGHVSQWKGEIKLLVMHDILYRHNYYTLTLHSVSLSSTTKSTVNLNLKDTSIQSHLK